MCGSTLESNAQADNEEEDNRQDVELKAAAAAQNDCENRASRSSPSLAVALNCGIGSSSLNAAVLFERSSPAWQGYGGFRARVFRANGRSAIAVYACMADDDACRPHSVHVLEVSEGAVASIVAFVGPLGPSLFSNTGLPLRPPN